MNSDVEIREMQLSDIKPYENNPRYDANAVEKVAASIKEYGYNQPIVVDAEGVIISGHVRYKALKKLKKKKVDVVVADLDEEKARQLRIADNKTAEYATWDRGYLIAELREFENKEAFFDPQELAHLIEDNLSARRPDVTREQIDAQREKMEDHHRKLAQKSNDSMINVKCQHCGEEFALQRENALNSAKMDADSDDRPPKNGGE